MATTQHQDPATTASGRTAKNEPRGVADTVADAASTAASTVAGAANDAMTRLPEAAATTRDASSRPANDLDGIGRQLRPAPWCRSDSPSACWSAAPTACSSCSPSSPRAAMGLTLLERQSGTPPKTPSATR
jgi:hypothetical protein